MVYDGMADRVTRKGNLHPWNLDMLLFPGSDYCGYNSIGSQKSLVLRLSKGNLLLLK